MLHFQNIFDQDSALATLAGAWRAGRLPHGLVFAGPEGVGKGTVAKALGDLFLCERPVDDGAFPRACGTCESCKVSAGGSHPDFHRIYKELIRQYDRDGKSVGVDLSVKVLRPELIEPAGRKSVVGQGKVFVVEQAELMNAQGQNSILKTLEEPLGRTLIVLLTDRATQLLPTILSRSQIVRFAPLPRATITRELVRRGIDDATAAAAAELADGSLGLAIRWLADGVVSAGGELAGLVDGAMAGRGDIDLQAWFRDRSDAYAGKLLERDPLSSKSQATRDGMTVYLGILSRALRKRLRTSGDDDTLEKTCAAIDAVIHAETLLDANVNIPLVFQHLQARLVP